MSTGELLGIEPLELKFPCKSPMHEILHSFIFLYICFCFVNLCLRFLGLVELKKQISCSLQLSNKTDNYVAFKVNWFPPSFLSFFISVCFVFYSFGSKGFLSRSSAITRTVMNSNPVFYNIDLWDIQISNYVWCLGQNNKSQEVLCPTKCWDCVASLHMWCYRCPFRSFCYHGF